MIKTLPSNEYWGRRSGSIDNSKPGGQTTIIGRVFRQQQYKSGASRSGKTFGLRLINVNKKWFKK